MNNLIVLTTEPKEESVIRKYTNKPEVRHQNIFNLLAESSASLFIVAKLLTCEILRGLNIHDPSMLEYLEKCYESFEEVPDRGFDEYLYSGIVPYTIPHFKVNKEKLLKLKFWQQAGAWCNDQITPIFKDTWKVAFDSANNCYCVKNYIKINQHQTIYCLNLYPGHHAGYSNYGGYCFLNNASVCAKTLLDSNMCSKIAILDLDYHAGDGTADIFKTDPRVTTVSIHANTDYDYPFYTCDNNDSNDMYYTKFISFNPNCTPEQYYEYVRIAIDYIKRDMPNVLIIAFGGDTYKNDPDASESCRCSLDFDNYLKIGQQIRSQFPNMPIVVTQEGGYDMENIAEIVLSFLKGLI
jgi:acetoin utilization deacetylase AcuC-like enzyme